MAVVVLVVHPERPEAVALAAKATEWLRQRGHEVRTPEGESSGAKPGAGGPGTTHPLHEGPLDLAVSLGGDGTMLRTVEMVSPAGVPVLGVNVGHLGYLTEVEASGLESALERFFAGDYGVEERMTLEVSVERKDGSAGPSCLALNEAVVEKTVSGHTVRLASSIAGRPFISYSADGVLVSTPTGSTAYNLSARGPIVSPRLRALIVTPVSPHMLFDRPLVLEPSEWLRLEVIGARPASLVVDGGTIAELAVGDAVSCGAGPHPALLVTFGGRDFHAILKAKFGLPEG